MLSKVTVFVLLCFVFSVCVLLLSIRIPLFIHSYHSFHSFFQFVRISNHHRIEFTNIRNFCHFLTSTQNTTYAHAHQSAVWSWINERKQFVVEMRGKHKNEKQPHTQRMQRMMILFALYVHKNNANIHTEHRYSMMVQK